MPARVGALPAAQEGLLWQVRRTRRRLGGDDGRGIRWRKPGVAAERVALPNLHDRVSDRRVARSSDADAELQPDAVTVLNDISSFRLSVQVIRPLVLLGP